MNVAQETLAMVAFEDQSPRILLWNTPFYDTKVFSNITFTLLICAGTMSHCLVIFLC